MGLTPLLSKMTEIIYDSCLLWEKAKDLAQDRGFAMTSECPLDKQCKGDCLIFNNDADRQMVRTKLTVLREELKNLSQDIG